MPIDSAENSRRRPGLPPRAPSSAGPLARAGARIQAAEAGHINRDSLFLDTPPPAPLHRSLEQAEGGAWLARMAGRWSLEAPQAEAYTGPLALAARMGQRISLVQIDDIARLVPAVPALNARRAGTHVAFDLDDTLIHKRREGPDADLETGLAQPGQTLEVLADLQARHPCMGLTARQYDAAYITYFQLDRLGIQLGASGTPGPIAGHENSGHIGGTYFAGHATPKGKLLDSLRRDFSDMRHLVFVDDQPHNFVSMVDAVLESPHDLQLTCVRYTRWRDDAVERQDWQDLRHVLGRRDVRALKTLVEKDGEWHRSLSDEGKWQPAFERRQRANQLAVTTALAQRLSPDGRPLDKRLEYFLADVRRDSKMRGPALDRLAGQVAVAQAAARQQDAEAPTAPQPTE